MIAVPWAHTHISDDGGRAGIGHRRRTKDREVLRRAQYGGHQDSVFTLFERLRGQPIPSPVSSRRDP